MKESIIIVGLQ